MGSLIPVYKRLKMVGLVVAISMTLTRTAQLSPRQEAIPPLPFSSDGEAVDFLKTARVVSRERIRQGVNQPFKVLLEKDGQQAFAVFRDVDMTTRRAEINGSFRVNYHDFAIFEVAAYELSQILGFNMVPPAVERVINQTRGSLQAWIDGAMTERVKFNQKLAAPRLAEWGRYRQLRDIFDTLVQNDDRNLGNTLIDSDWKLWLIDCTRCFYPLTQLKNPEKLVFIESHLWEALKTTPEKLVRDRLRAYLEKTEIDALMKRWKQLVKHYSAEIKKRGERSVLFSIEPAS